MLKIAVSLQQNQFFYQFFFHVLVDVSHELGAKEMKLVFKRGRIHLQKQRLILEKEPHRVLRDHLTGNLLPVNRKRRSVDLLVEPVLLEEFLDGRTETAEILSAHDIKLKKSPAGWGRTFGNIY